MTASPHRDAPPPSEASLLAALEDLTRWDARRLQRRIDGLRKVRQPEVRDRRCAEIDAAIEAVGRERGEDDPAEAEQERAMALARGALRRYAAAPDKYSFQRRLGGFLQRRGFTLETIRPIVDILWRELQAQDQ